MIDNSELGTSTAVQEENNASANRSSVPTPVDFTETQTTYVGTEFGEYITGNALSNTIDGGGGNDTIYGDGGNDVLRGGDGNDTIYDHGISGLRDSDTGGVDRMEGGAGRDSIYDGGGVDVILGGDGDDFIVQWRSDQVGDSDWIYGGNGNDQVQYVGRIASEYTVVYNVDGILTVTHNASGAVDRLFQIEIIRFGDVTIDTSGPIPTVVNLVSAQANYDGTSADEIITATTQNNIIHGRDGDDTIYGNGGNDILRGGEGDDFIQDNGPDNNFDPNTSGVDRMEGGAGNDRIYDWGGVDVILGDDGDDSIWQWQSHQSNDNDWIYGGRGLDSVRYAGEFAVDYTIAYDATGVLTVTHNESGALDRLFQIETIIFGDATFDTNSVFPTVVRMPVSQANYSGTSGQDIVTGNDLNNTIDGGGGNDTIYAGFGDDVVDGSAGDDTIYGDGGNDVLRGGDGNDTIHDHGSSGLRDSSTGGVDRMEGGAGRDSIYDGGGVDVILGGDGDDYIVQWRSDEVGDNDWIYGGQGQDRVHYVNEVVSDYTIAYDATGVLTVTHNESGALDRLFHIESLIFGNTTVDTMGRFLLLAGETSGDDTLTGTFQSETIAGLQGNDIIYAGAGDDELLGEEGSDRLFGEEGDDRLDGGEGADVLIGGNGDDVFFDTAGRDWNYGQAGDDYFVAYADAYDNLFHGGSGTDSIEYVGLSSLDVLIERLGDDTLRVTDADGHIDTLIGIEFLRFVDGDLSAADIPASAAKASSPVLIDDFVAGTDVADMDMLL